MNELSPLGRLLLKIMRFGTIAAAFLLVAFLGLTLWQKTRLGGLEALSRQDYSFMGILVLMLVGALWLYRAIGREMKHPGA